MGKGSSLYSDSLLSVGNFLGAGTSNAANSVAQQQLRATNSINDNVKTILGTMNKLGLGNFPL